MRNNLYLSILFICKEYTFVDIVNNKFEIYK